MSNFTSLDIEHKRELLFNSMALYKALNKLSELIGVSRQELIFDLYGALGNTINNLSDQEISQHIETMEAVFQDPKKFIVEGEIKT